VRLITPAALRSERGFTLVELLVVLVLIGILLGIALTTYVGYRDRANNTVAQDNIHRIMPAIHAYFVDHDSYSGMTLANLKVQYDAGIDPADYSFGSVPPSDSSFCVQSSSSDRTWRKNGPTASFEPQACP
jgi:prepilin-type N-terminal cleavage/methylation domain-containing protein